MLINTSCPRPWQYRVLKKNDTQLLYRINQVQNNGHGCYSYHYLQKTFLHMLVKFERKSIIEWIYLEILLLNWRHPLFNLHRYLIIGNRPNPIDLLNVGHFKTYSSLQMLSKHFIKTKVLFICIRLPLFSKLITRSGKKHWKT